MGTKEKLREALDESLSKLQTEYMDLFAFHGINTFAKLDAVVKEGGLLEVAEEYRKAGKIRHIGFSTHAHADVIIAAIETGK